MIFGAVMHGSSRQIFVKSFNTKLQNNYFQRSHHFLTIGNYFLLIIQAHYKNYLKWLLILQLLKMLKNILNQFLKSSRLRITGEVYILHELVC